MGIKPPVDRVALVIGLGQGFAGGSAPAAPAAPAAHSAPAHHAAAHHAAHGGAPGHRGHAAAVGQHPVGQEQDLLAVPAAHGPGGLDDQRAVEALVQLVAEVGVIKIGARRVGAETVGEAPAGRHGGLGDAGHPVHGVGHGLAVPVDGGGPLQAVAQDHLQLLALPHPDHRSRRLAVEGKSIKGGASTQIDARLLGRKLQFGSPAAHPGTDHRPPAAAPAKAPSEVCRNLRRVYSIGSILS